MKQDKNFDYQQISLIKKKIKNYFFSSLINFKISTSNYLFVKNYFYYEL